MLSTTYRADGDGLYVRLARPHTKIVATAPCAQETPLTWSFLNFDLDEEHRIVGIEIVDASRWFRKIPSDEDTVVTLRGESAVVSFVGQGQRASTYECAYPDGFHVVIGLSSRNTLCDIEIPEASRQLREEFVGGLRSGH